MRSSRRWRWRRPKPESWASNNFSSWFQKPLFFPNKFYSKGKHTKVKMRLIPLVKVDPMIWGSGPNRIGFPPLLLAHRETGGTDVLAFFFFFFFKYQVSRHALYQCFLILFGSLVWSLYFHFHA